MIAEACYALTPPGPANSPADSLVRDLVGRARNGDKQAWDALVERYAPLIWSICRRHRLGHADADDVGQSVWLRLVDQLDRVREPADAVRRYQRPARHPRRQHWPDPEPLPGQDAPPPGHRRPEERLTICCLDEFGYSAPSPGVGALIQGQALAGGK